MTLLDRIVSVSITRSGVNLTQQGFGTPLILAASPAEAGVVGYGDLDEMVDAGYATSHIAYKLAERIWQQDPRLPEIKVAQLTAEVAQVDTLTPTVANNFEYTVTINGVEFSFTSDADATAAEIVAGLIAAINAGTEPVTASGSTTLILTADDTGVGFTVDEGPNMAIAHTTPNNGAAEDIAAARDIDDDWYFLLLGSVSDSHVKSAAAYIETINKLFLFRNADSDVKTSATDDLASELKALNYDRTAFCYSDDLTNYLDAAMVGKCGPLDPGSETWANKNLVGATADSFTSAELDYLDDKNVNFYITIAGLSVTQNGKCVSGEYIDVIRFIDWLQARIQEGVFSDIASAKKIPYTDAGIAVVEARLRAVLQSGVRAGGLVSYEVTVPAAADISDQDKADRNLTGVSFTGQLAGAVHKTTITGTVTL
jgi:hypothetical protein